ncbi:MAG: nuclear transport factor 2 family protein [Jatrophihabitans sp.]
MVARYFDATDTGDVSALADCFSADGGVDEGRTYRGHAEIIGWLQALATSWTYTSTITGGEATGPDQTSTGYRCGVQRDFPGGGADLSYRFVLRDGVIEHLQIVG